MKEGCPTLEKSLVRGTWQQKRSFSPAVITKGAQTIVWVAAIPAPPQMWPFACRQLRCTVSSGIQQYRQDARRGRLQALGYRHHDGVLDRCALHNPDDGTASDLFGGDNFPASAAITVTGFANPDIMLEINVSPSVRDSDAPLPRPRNEGAAPRAEQCSR